MSWKALSTKSLHTQTLEKREINIDLAEQVLRDIISPNEKKVITPEFIIDTVADHFDITPSDIVGSKRSSKIVFPRQIAMYLCREMLDAPLTGIGKMMGDRDHTTVMHGIEKIEKEMSAKDSVRNTVDILKKKINPSKIGGAFVTLSKRLKPIYIYIRRNSSVDRPLFIHKPMWKACG